LAREAEGIITTSAQVTVQGSAVLAGADMENRARAADDLLAKVVVDLGISQALFAAASDGQQGGSSSALATQDRTASADLLVPIEDELALLEGSEAAEATSDRAFWKPRTVDEARALVADVIEDALKVIPRRATRSGQEALRGLVGTATAEIAMASGLFQTGIGALLQHSDGLSHAYQVACQFIGQAFDSLKALVQSLLPQSVINEITKAVTSSLTEAIVRAGVDRLCQGESVRQAVTAQISISTATLDRFGMASDRLKLLVSSHDRQASRIDKVVKLASWAGHIPTTIVPQIKLIVAAIYLGAGVFTLLDAADRFDAPGSWMPQFVVGVRGIVQEQLA